MAAIAHLGERQTEDLKVPGCSRVSALAAPVRLCCLWLKAGAAFKLLCNWHQLLRDAPGKHAEARLDQPAGRKALNLVVVGSSPTVGAVIL